MAAIFNPGSSRAANVSAYKTKLGDFIVTQSDGSRRVNREAFMQFFIGEMDQVVAMTSAPTQTAFAWNDVQSQLSSIVSRLEQAVNPSNWVEDPDWPLTPTSSASSRVNAELVAKVDQFQGDSITAAHAIINYFEGKLANLRDFLRRWVQNKVLTVHPGDPGAFPEADPDLPRESRVYVWTHVTDRSEESDWSPVSAMVTVDPRDTVTVTRGDVASGYNITHWRLYRSSTTNTGAAFQYVPEGEDAGIPVATSTVTDDHPQVALEETGQTRGWLMPPENLRGLVAMPNNFLAGFYDQTLAFSHPNYPHAWPMEYRLTVEPPIVALAVVDQTLFVGTRAHPYVVSGADPSSMSMLKLDVHQPVMSKRSVAVGGGGVVFAGADGLFVFHGMTLTNVTEGVYSREDWQALRPETMIGAMHDGVYYCLYGTGAAQGCLVFDPKSKKVGTVDLKGSAFYVDRFTDTLFVADGRDIRQVQGSSSPRTGVWKSKKFTLPKYAPFAWLHVESDFSDGASVEVKIWGDGALVYTATVTSRKPVRLPAGRYLEWEVQLTSATQVTAYLLASGTKELQVV
jgi:hypothetical protein